MRLKIIFNKNNKYSSSTVTKLSILIYFCFMVTHANFIYIQFSLLQILSVALVNLAILLILATIFLKTELSAPLILNIKNMWLVFFNFLLLVILSSILPAQILSFTNPLILLETELGLGWNHDTAFNIALIQSILNFGYPSTAQNGHPIIIYHALSHYVDALILGITRVQPYDSYGLLFHFKVFLLTSSAALFISTITRRRSANIYFISIILFIPLIIGNGLGIGSHSLWFSSILMLISAPYIFSKLFKKAPESSIYLYTLFLIIIIALTKISSGIMLASLIFSIIFINKPKILTTYIFGAVLIIFFYLWGLLYISNGSKVLLNYSSLGIYDFINYYFLRELYPGAFKITPFIITSILTILTIFLISFNRIVGATLVSSIFSSIMLYFITNNISNPSDIWYFQYSLSFPLLLMTFYMCINYGTVYFEKINILNCSIFTEINKSRFTIKILVPIIFAAIFSAISFYLSRPHNAIYNLISNISITIQSVNTQQFSIINRKLPADIRLSIKRLYMDGFDTLKDRLNAEFSSFRVLNDLSLKLDSQLSIRGLVKKNVALFIPKEIFDESLKKFGGSNWDQGLLIYAVTGIQLIHGVGDIPYGYGFSIYSKQSSASRVEVNMFDLVNSCKIADITHIILVYRLEPLKIEIATCKQVPFVLN